MTKDKIYSKEEIRNIIFQQSHNEISEVALHKRINKMIDSGELSRVGNGRYIFTSKKRFGYINAYEISLDILNKLKNRFDNSAKYIIYESTILNLFLNHLIGHPTTIVEVEKDLVETVYWFLKESGYQNVLLNPNENENYTYNQYDGKCIIVKTMVSQSPINNKQHTTTIEKLLVDIVCDKTLNMFYEGAEIPSMVEDILNKYAVKYDTVRNYAKRRHCLDRLINYLPEELKGALKWLNKKHSPKII